MKKLSYEKMKYLLNMKFNSKVTVFPWYDGSVCLDCDYWTVEMEKYVREHKCTSGNDFSLLGHFERLEKTH